MRVDLALKYLCLVKSRSSVKHLCDDGSLWINDHPVKPSATLRPGDRVEIRTTHRTMTIDVVSVPERQLSKSASLAYYTKLAESGTAGEHEPDW
jgi:ribosome-associated heat shock protein Hsp15